MTMNAPSPGNVKAEVGFLWIKGLPDLIKLCVYLLLGKFYIFLNHFSVFFNLIYLVFNFIRLLEVF